MPVILLQAALKNFKCIYYILPFCHFKGCISNSKISDNLI